jgi:hypothetical protein
VVVLPDDPAFYDGEEVNRYAGARRYEIELAATMILSSLPRLGANLVVDVSEPAGTVAPIDVTVTAQYVCGLVSLICGGDEAVALSSTTTHTLHGASYQYSTPASLAGSTAALTRAGSRTSPTNQPGSARPARPAAMPSAT